MQIRILASLLRYEVKRRDDESGRRVDKVAEKPQQRVERGTRQGQRSTGESKSYNAAQPCIPEPTKAWRKAHHQRGQKSGGEEWKVSRRPRLREKVRRRPQPDRRLSEPDQRGPHGVELPAQQKHSRPKKRLKIKSLFL